jgi:hypothetical protein
MARPLIKSLPDWLLGAPGKRRVLTRVLLEPEREWTGADIAAAVDADRHAGLEIHLRSLVRWGLMEQVPEASPASFRLVPTDQLDDELRAVREGLELLLPALSRLAGE